MLKQLEILAKEVRPSDYMMFGNEMYRVYTAGSVGKDEYPRMKDGSPAVVIALITDKRHDMASNVIIDCYLWEDHPVTVFRES